MTELPIEDALGRARQRFQQADERLAELAERLSRVEGQLTAA